MQKSEMASCPAIDVRNTYGEQEADEKKAGNRDRPRVAQKSKTLQPALGWVDHRARGHCVPGRKAEKDFPLVGGRSSPVRVGPAKNRPLVVVEREEEPIAFAACARLLRGIRLPAWVHPGP